MNLGKQDAGWALGYLAVAGAFLDYWNWGTGDPLLWGMPYWIPYLVLLCLVLGVHFALFSQRRWRA